MTRTLLTGNAPEFMNPGECPSDQDTAIRNPSSKDLPILQVRSLRYMIPYLC